MGGEARRQAQPVRQRVQPGALGRLVGVDGEPRGEVELGRLFLRRGAGGDVLEGRWALQQVEDEALGLGIEAEAIDLREDRLAFLRVDMAVGLAAPVMARTRASWNSGAVAVKAGGGSAGGAAGAGAAEGGEPCCQPCQAR